MNEFLMRRPCAHRPSAPTSSPQRSSKEHADAPRTAPHYMAATSRRYSDHPLEPALHDPFNRGSRTPVAGAISHRAWRFCSGSLHENQKHRSEFAKQTSAPMRGSVRPELPGRQDMAPAYRQPTDGPHGDSPFPSPAAATPAPAIVLTSRTPLLLSDGTTQQRHILLAAHHQRKCPLSKRLSMT